MTGTAATEADEFAEIYKLDVVEIPTNRPVERVDEDDEVYRTVGEKYEGIIARDRRRRIARRQPMLVGTTSIEKSEQLAELLQEGRLHAARLFATRTRSTDSTRAAREGRRDQALRGAERPLPRAGGLHRRRGRRAGRDHHRHQHGRPRHRHPARRQRRDAGRAGARGPAEGRSATPRSRDQGRDRREPRQGAGIGRAGRSRGRRKTALPAASTSSAPSATRSGASTTSCAAAPAARAIPAARSSTCRCRTT